MPNEPCESVTKIINSFDILKKILNDRAVCLDDSMIIFDPPFEIRIMRKEEMLNITFEGEDVAVISKGRCWIKEGFESYVEEWIVALTSLGFKRFILKNKENSI